MCMVHGMPDHRTLAREHCQPRLLLTRLKCGVLCGDRLYWLHEDGAHPDGCALPLA